MKNKTKTVSALGSRPLPIPKSRVPWRFLAPQSHDVSVKKKTQSLEGTGRLSHGRKDSLLHTSSKGKSVQMLSFNKRGQSPRVSCWEAFPFPVPFTTPTVTRGHPSVFAEGSLSPQHRTKAVGSSRYSECVFRCKVCNHDIKMRLFARTALRRGSHIVKGS